MLCMHKIILNLITIMYNGLNLKLWNSIMIIHSVIMKKYQVMVMQYCIKCIIFLENVHVLMLSERKVKLIYII